MTTARRWLGVWLVVSMWLLSLEVGADDFPLFRLNPQRTGATNLSTETGPGRAFLRWWWPAQQERGVTLQIDRDGVNRAGDYQVVQGTVTTITVTNPNASTDAFRDSYDYATAVNPSNPDDPTSGATVVVRWRNATPDELDPDNANYNPQIARATRYRISVWFPSSGTANGRNAREVVYRVRYPVGATDYREMLFLVDQTTGGGWVRLGTSGSTAYHRNAGGGWDRITLPADLTFPFDGRRPIEVYAYNTSMHTDEDGNFNDAGRFVVFDAVQFQPEIGSFYSSPVAATVQVAPGRSEQLIYIGRIERTGRQPRPGFTDQNLDDPNTPEDERLFYVLTEEVGVMYCYDNVGRVVWRYPLNVTGQRVVTVDDADGPPTFLADAVWSAPATLQPDPYGTTYLQTVALPVSNPLLWSRVRWQPDLQPSNGRNTARYAVYVWLPQDDGTVQRTTVARYIIRHAEGDTVVEVDQTQNTTSGQWISLGTYVMQRGSNNYVELVNYTRIPAEAGRIIVADAVRFVELGTGASGIYSTPTVQTLPMRLPGGVVANRQVVFFTANDGRVYAVDALGNGDGTTFSYWVWPEQPQNERPPVGSFGYSSPVVVDIGTSTTPQWRLYVANSNGRVYSLRADGNGDFGAGSPGTTELVWVYPASNQPAVPTGFVSSPAYNRTAGVGPTIFVGGLDGRLYALDAEGSDDTTTERWVYPGKYEPASGGNPALPEELPLDPISTTPAVFDGKVYFASADGRVYCVRERGTGRRRTERVWVWPYAQRPPVRTAGDEDPVEPFLYSSPTVAAGVVTAGDPANLRDVVFIGDRGGRMYALDAQGLGNGRTELLWRDVTDATNPRPSGSQPLGGAIYSSATFTQIIPSRSISGTLPQPAIVVGTMDGLVLALSAFNSGPGTFRAAIDDTSQSRQVRGDILWGWRTEGQSVFASPAVANGWLYIAGDDGILYAFSPTGGFLTPGSPPGGEALDPNLVSDLQNLQVEVFQRDEYLLIANGTRAPEEILADGHTRKTAYEWGETVYVVAFGMRGALPPVRSVTLSLRSRAANVERTVGVRPYTYAGEQRWMAFHAFRILPTQDGDAWTPGATYTAAVRVTSSQAAGGGGAQQAAVITTDRLPVPPFEFVIAHPIALRLPNPTGTWQEVGWIGRTIDGGSVPPILRTNGNGDVEVVAALGAVPHGASSSWPLQIADRSKVQMQRGEPLRVKVQRANIAWLNNNNGSLAVINPLPWDELPVNIPNTSRDYPDIPDRAMRVSVGGTDLAVSQRGGVLAAPVATVGDPNDPIEWTLTPTVGEAAVQVPLFQPANLQGYWTRRPVRVYIDVNNNGQLDLPGGEALRQTPPVTREEPYREFRISLVVPPDIRLRVEEETVDLGTVPHGFGIHPDTTNFAFRPPLSDSDPVYNTNPWYQSLKPFWKPFTVRSLSNVNLLNVRAVGSVDYLNASNSPIFQNPLPITLQSDWVNPYYWEINPIGDPNFLFHRPALTAGWVRRSDGRVVQQNVFTSIDSVFDALWMAARPPQYQGFPGMHTLHKPRPDHSPTVLSIPDVPYAGARFPNGFVYDGRNIPTTKPLISVQVPLGTPAGTYSNYIRITEATGWNPYVLGIRPDSSLTQPVSEPTVRVKVTVTESRLTNSAPVGSLPHADVQPQGTPPQPGVPGFLAANVQPSAFMTLVGFAQMNFFVAWSSNWSQSRLVEDANDTYREAQPAASNAWFLRLLNLSRTLAQPNWVPASPNRWWNTTDLEYPRDPTNPSVRDKYGRLFTTQPGVVIPSSIRHYAPTFFLSGGQLYLLWQGQAAKRQPATGVVLQENVTFVAPIVNGVPTNPVALPNDPTIPRFKPRVAVVGTTPVLFWYSGSGGRYAIYYSVCTGDPLNPNSWSRERQLPTPASVTNALEPLPVARTGGFIDLIYTASTKTRRVDEILLTRYQVAGGGRLTPVALPPVRGEVLQRVGTTNLWMSRDLSWDSNQRIRIWRVGDAQPLAANDIQQAGSYWYDQRYDSNTGILYLTRYTDSARTQIDWQAAIDLSAGTVTFPYRAPGRNDVVFADYTPRTMRVTANHGWNSLVPNDGVPVPQPIAFYAGANGSPAGGIEKSLNPRWKYVLPVVTNPVNSPLVDRLWVLYRKTTSSPAAQVFVVKTMRLGVQLPTPVYTPVITDPQGERRPDVSTVAVTGVSAPLSGRYEVDFARGRVYFTEADDGKLVRITYRALDAQGNPEPSPRTVTGVIRWIDETSEATEGSQAMVPLVGATSESDLFVIKDLLEPKLWLLWSSSRTGTLDLFYQTFSPRLYPDVIVP